MKHFLRVIFLFLLPILFSTCNLIPPDAKGNKTYKIAVSDDITNGKITVKDDLKMADRGTQITLLIEPNYYYELASVGYMTGGRTYNIYSNYNETTQECTFTMPSADIEVIGRFDRYFRRIYTNVNPSGGGSITTEPANTAIPMEKLM